MSILTGKAIHEQIEKGVIGIDPYSRLLLNPNSLDVRLGPTLRVYETRSCPYVSPHSPGWYGMPSELDPRKNCPTREVKIPEDGFALNPGVLYLGHTLEYTDCGPFAPMLEGKSSLARLGVTIHQTGGVGDAHFRGQWVCEIVIHGRDPVRVYPGMRFAQLIFHTLEGEITPYTGRYKDQSGPVASRLWQDHGAKGEVTP